MTSEPTTRDKLIAAMSSSLRARGFGSTAMKDLLATSGISSGSMYHFFPGGKEELAAAAIRDVGLDAAERIRKVFTASTSVAEGVRRIFDALIADLEQAEFAKGCPIGVPATEAVGLSADIQAACQEVFGAWVKAYADALIHEGWAEAEATSMGTAIVTTYEGSVTIARALRSTEAVARARDDVSARVAKV